MTDGEPVEGPGDAEDGIELTPEEREGLHETMKRLRRTLGPRVEFKFPQIGGLQNFAAEMTRLPVLRFPESPFKSLSVLTGFPAHQSKVFDAFKPALGAQEAWKKRLAVIDSDIFKRAALAQVNLDFMTAHLAKNVDFGLGDTFAKVAQQVAAQQSVWLRTLGPAFESFRLSFYPPNLRNIEGLRWEDVQSVVMVDGIALYGVPRTSIASAIIRANSAAKRRDILGRQWKAISADCRGAVESCETVSVRSYMPAARAALDALDAGHSAASQALTGALLDAMVNSYFGKDRHLYTPDKLGKRTNAAYDEFTAHEYIAFAPIWQAWQKFFPAEGVPIPHTFSRNATAHTVNARQYTKRNAIQSLMIASSLIYFFDREAQRVAAA